MGVLYGSMGLATMLFPSQIMELSLDKDFLGKDGVTPAIKLITQCFGSQAAVCGLLIISSEFKRETYRNFGLAMIPYIIFDIQFWKKGALSTFGAAGDGAGNIAFIICCWLGYSQFDKRKLS